MYFRKLLLISVVSTLVFGQSIHNSIGLGLYSGYSDAASSGTGSLGLVPAFDRQLSVSNPSTWHNSRYAILGGNFSSQMVDVGSGSNSYADIGPLQLILPIAGKYSWGINIRPITNNNYNLLTSVADYVFFEDTLSAQYSIEGAGGISSIETAVGFPLTEYEHQALQLEVMFGSSRHSSIISLDDDNYYYSRHDSYTGMNVNYYLNSHRYTIQNRPLNLYFSLGLALQPLKIRSVQYHLYEDSDGSGYYSDYYDFPYISSSKMEETEIYEDTYHPFELSIGASYRLASLVELNTEYLAQFNSSELPDFLKPINDYYFGNYSHFNLGIVKFTKPLSRALKQKIQLRAGVYYDGWEIKPADEKLIETGISLGAGFKFGFSNNSINLAYSIGSRRGPVLDETETVEKLEIQIAIGDTWFVKRRKR